MNVNGVKVTMRESEWFADREPLITEATHAVEREKRLEWLSEGILHFCLFPGREFPDMQFGTDGGRQVERDLWNEFLVNRPIEIKWGERKVEDAIQTNVIDGLWASVVPSVDCGYLWEIYRSTSRRNHRTPAVRVASGRERQERDASCAAEAELERIVKEEREM